MMHPSDPRWKTAETTVESKGAPTGINLDVRQSAYNIARGIMDHGGAYAPLTRTMATNYYNLMHGHGSEAARAAAADALYDQLKSELQAAEVLLKVIPHHMHVFLDAISEHNAHTDLQ